MKNKNQMCSIYLTVYIIYRDCIQGENIYENECFKCVNNTFSFKNNSINCFECPYYATCKGKYYFMFIN